jgi:hypothetical protein
MNRLGEQYMARQRTQPGRERHRHLRRALRCRPACGAPAYVRSPSGRLRIYLTGPGQHNGRLPTCHLDFRARACPVTGSIAAASSRSAWLPDNQESNLARLVTSPSSRGTAAANLAG